MRRWPQTKRSSVVRRDFGAAQNVHGGLYLVVVLGASHDPAGGAGKPDRSEHVASAGGGNVGDSTGPDRAISRPNDFECDEFRVISSDSDEIQFDDRADLTPVSNNQICLELL